MRYRQLRRKTGETDTPRPNRDESFRTGGCCSCCVEDEEDRCCCCRCACCDPEGISAEYIMGVIPVGDDSEEEEHRCCCGKEREKEKDEESMPPLPDRSVEPVVASAQEVGVQPSENGVAVRSVNAMAASSQMNANTIPPQANVNVASAPVNSVQTPANTASHANPRSSMTLPTTQHTPPVVVVPESVLPTNSNGIPVLTNVHLVEAIAEDGSGKTVYVAVPNVQ